MIVSTDFEALYAYKRGDYQRYLQMSTKNVRTLFYADCLQSDVLACPEFIQLLDDDIVSLTALTLIVNPKCRDYTSNTLINQSSLSLYLMTQCQLKLMAQTLQYVKDVQRNHSRERTLDHLTLKLIERKLALKLIARRLEPFAHLVRSVSIIRSSGQIVKWEKGERYDHDERGSTNP